MQGPKSEADMRQWASEVDEARQSQDLSQALSLDDLEYVREILAADKSGELSMMAKEVFVTLIAEAMNYLPAEISIQLGQMIADCQDSPRDIMIFPSAWMLPIVETVQSFRYEQLAALSLMIELSSQTSAQPPSASSQTS